MKKICFVGNDNYPVLNPEYGNSYIGGESVQQTLLAKAFSGNSFNYDVSMIVLDHGQPDGEMVHAVKVWKSYAQSAGLPVVRFIYPRITGLWRALKKADADIYYQSCAGAQTGIVAYFCKKYGRKLVFRIAHDTDCIPGEELITYKRDKRIYQYGIKNADLVVAQSTQQQALLANNYTIESPVINMAVETPSATNLERDIDILWVNNIREFKRPELCVELARMNPQLNFVMIGGSCTGSEALFSRITKESKLVDNLDYKGFVPYHEVNNYYQRSKLFVNTSDSEGFPNSFLQAWIRGAPVISFFDPDGIIERERLGKSPENIHDMSDTINQLVTCGDDYKAMSDTARSFAFENYAAESVVSEYIRLFELAGIVEKQ